MTFFFGDVREVGLPSVRIKNGRAVLVEPIDLLLAEEENAAQNELRNAVWMGLGISQGESGTPRTAKNQPTLNGEVLADLFDVGYEIPRGVFVQGSVGRALAAAALVEVDDAVLCGVEKPTLFGIGTSSGPAV